MNITLKKIDKQDLEQLRKWRMQDNVSKYMITDPVISKKSQINWYNRVISDKSRIDFVILCDNKQIGYYGITNIDKNNGSCEIGFYIGDIEYRGKGIFKIVQKLVEDIIFYSLKLSKIIIKVLENNPILEVYLKNGFVEDENFKYTIMKYNIEYNVFYLYKLKP